MDFGATSLGKNIELEAEKKKFKREDRSLKRSIVRPGSFNYISDLILRCSRKPIKKKCVRG